MSVLWAKWCNTTATAIIPLRQLKLSFEIECILLFLMLLLHKKYIKNKIKKMIVVFIILVILC